MEDAVYTEAKLIAENINILGITELDGMWAVRYEFPYRTKTVPKRWTKQVYITNQKSEGQVYEGIYSWVLQLREMLEREVLEV